MSTTRVYLVASSLARLIEKERKGHHVQQGYFPDQPSRSISVRLEGDTSRLILITHGPNGPVEEATDLPHRQAEALLDLAGGRVEYLSVGLTIGSQTATLHRFITPGPLDLVTVAFEQTEQARTFHPVPWFGPEVSHDPAYQARSMALAGLPSGTEVEITDAALDSLLDTLDNGSETREPQPVTAPVLLETALGAEPEPDADDLDLEDSVTRELARSLRPQLR
jgi:CYTH domain-containing protein